MNERDRNFGPQRLYRDHNNAMLMGVCAGLADYFGWNVTLVRGLTLVALFWFMPATLFIYLALGLLLPKKPARLYEWDTDEEYWRSVRRSARDTFRDLRHRFRESDLRLQRMESYVTSRRYDLDKQFRDLES